MAKLLHCNNEKGIERLSSVLDDCEVHTATSMSAAERKLDSDDYDLIVVGVHFDDSRAVELFRYIRAHDRHKKTPFVFVRTQPSGLARFIHDTIAPLRNVFFFNGYIETDLLGEDDERIKRAILKWAIRDDKVETKGS